MRNLNIENDFERLNNSIEVSPIQGFHIDRPLADHLWRAWNKIVAKRREPRTLSEQLNKTDRALYSILVRIISMIERDRGQGFGLECQKNEGNSLIKNAHYAENNIFLGTLNRDSLIALSHYTHSILFDSVENMTISAIARLVLKHAEFPHFKRRHRNIKNLDARVKYAAAHCAWSS